jgi:hypothetical protein
VTASKLNKRFATAGKGAKKRAIVEGFAEENFFLGGCESSKKVGVEDVVATPGHRENPEV